MGRIAGEEVAQSERELAHQALGGLDGGHYGCLNGRRHQLIRKKDSWQDDDCLLLILSFRWPVAVEKFVMLRRCIDCPADGAKPHLVRSAILGFRAKRE